MVFIIMEGPKMKDKELIDLYLCRNENAIAITKEQYGKRIRQLLYCIIKDYDYVEDISQNLPEEELPNLSYQFVYDFSPMLEEQLLLGGYRLAYVLNTIFSGRN